MLGVATTCERWGAREPLAVLPPLRAFPVRAGRWHPLRVKPRRDVSRAHPVGVQLKHPPHNPRLSLVNLDLRGGAVARREVAVQPRCCA